MLPSRFERPLPRIEARSSRTRSRPARRYGPTADDWEFYLVRVQKGERTCLACGETFSAGRFCDRCGLPEPGEHGGKGRLERLPPSMPTESYLRPEEYRRV